MTVGAVVLGISAFVAAPISKAQDDVAGKVGQQCRDQYPAGGGYSEGIAYLAPPGDVYSWRCKQVSPSGGGAITDLPVDLTGIIGGS